MGPMLKSGNLDAFRPTGSDGAPVYLSAPQLLSLLRERAGETIAGCFALPRRSEQGERIDWYAPNDARRVVPWSAADEHERAEAKSLLLEAQAQLVELAGELIATDNREQQRFGRYLSQMTKYPSDQDVFIVDGKPVVTFWSFEHRDAGPGHSRFIDLPVADPTGQPFPARRLPWWLLALFALLLVLALLLWWTRCSEAPQDPPSADPAATASQQPDAMFTDAANPDDQDALPRGDGQTAIADSSDHRAAETVTDAPEAMAVEPVTDAARRLPRDTAATTLDQGQDSLSQQDIHSTHIDRNTRISGQDATRIDLDRDVAIQVQGVDAVLVEPAGGADQDLRIDDRVDVDVGGNIGLLPAAGDVALPVDSAVDTGIDSDTRVVTDTGTAVAIDDDPAVLLPDGSVSVDADKNLVDDRVLDDIVADAEALSGMRGTADGPGTIDAQTGADSTDVALDTDRQANTGADIGTDTGANTGMDDADIGPGGQRPGDANAPFTSDADSDSDSNLAPDADADPNLAPDSDADNTPEIAPTPDPQAAPVLEPLPLVLPGLGPGIGDSPEDNATTDAADAPAQPGSAVGLTPSGVSVDADAAGMATGDRTGTDSPASRSTAEMPPGQAPRQSAADSAELRKLDGSWRARTALRDERGRAVRLGLEMRDGRGEIRLERKGVEACRSPAVATATGGTVIIVPETNLDCGGTNFGRPRLECTPGSDGTGSACVGRYDSGDTFNVNITRP
jgi:hypothetical protein